MAQQQPAASTRHTRSNPQYPRHQQLASSGRVAQDLGRVAGPQLPPARALVNGMPPLVNAIANSWAITSALLGHMDRRQYNALRLAGSHTLTAFLPANQRNQATAHTNAIGIRCQNMRNYVQYVYPYYPGRDYVPFPPHRPDIIPTPCPNNPSNSAPLLRPCAGDPTLNAAPRGHDPTTPFYVCDECASESFQYHDFTDWLPSRVLELCDTCTGLVRHRRPAGAAPDPCLCARDFAPANPDHFWLCSACRRAHARACYARILRRARRFLPVLNPALPPTNLNRWVDAHRLIHPLRHRNGCLCNLTYPQIRQSYAGSLQAVGRLCLNCLKEVS